MSGEQSVLVVEDDEGLANIIALILGQEGFDVRTAHNGTLGYFAYFHEPTEWVVTDIQMPELDGLQMMQGIRSINPNVKVVYMSGEVDKYHMALDQEISEFGVLLVGQRLVPGGRRRGTHRCDGEGVRGPRASAERSRARDRGG